MDYTTSDAFATNVGTGHRLHQDSAPITTVVSAKDMNQLIWNLMKLLADAGISAATFDPDDVATYNRVSLAVQALAGIQLSAFTGGNQSLAANGFQKLPGGLILQWCSVAVGDVPTGTGTGATTTLPTTFPNACLRALLAVEDASSQPATVAWVTAKTTSSVSWRIQEWFSPNVQSSTVLIFAIGY